MDRVTDRLSAPATQCVSDGQTDSWPRKRRLDKFVYVTHTVRSMGRSIANQHCNMPHCQMREVAADQGWAGAVKEKSLVSDQSVRFNSQCTFLTVSLYGDGYVSMPLQEAKMSTNIRVKFRTRQEDAFLFLAAGRTDYCLLRLENGIISFSYKIEQNVVQVSKRVLNQLQLGFQFQFSICSCVRPRSKSSTTWSGTMWLCNVSRTMSPCRWIVT